MRFVHRLVIVAGLFLLMPTLIYVRGLAPGPWVSHSATAPEILQAAGVALGIAAVIIYPIAWLFAGFRR
jgi:hypothetical protein